MENAACMADGLSVRKMAARLTLEYLGIGTGTDVNEVQSPPRPLTRSFFAR